jgi:hypothetical protein
MIEGGNGRYPYKVVISEDNREILLQKHREAAFAGKGHQFIAAFRLILHELHNKPFYFWRADL